MGRKEVIGRLRQLEALRQAVEAMDRALQALTPEERLVIQMTDIEPEKRAADKLCQMLSVERSGVYRRRNRALEKIEKALSISN